MKKMNINFFFFHSMVVAQTRQPQTRHLEIVFFVFFFRFKFFRLNPDVHRSRSRRSPRTPQTVHHVRGVRGERFAANSDAFTHSPCEPDGANVFGVRRERCERCKRRERERAEFAANAAAHK